MGNYVKNIIDLKSSSSHIPFEVTEWSGTTPEGVSGAMYMVTTGDCFSTFSYSSGSKVNIKGLQSGFEWSSNSKVYLDFTILSNLQVSGASVRCGLVGSGAKNGNSEKNLPHPSGWIDYPNMFRTVPEDTLDYNGFVKVIAEGKRQTHSYLLLGIRSDDLDPYGVQSNPPAVSGSNFQPIQKINTNLIMMMGGHNGVPVTFPMPWFAGCEPSGQNFLA